MISQSNSSISPNNNNNFLLTLCLMIISAEYNYFIFWGGHRVNDIQDIYVLFEHIIIIIIAIAHIWHRCMLYQSKSHSSHVLTLIFFISNRFRAQNFFGIRYFHVNFTHRIGKLKENIHRQRIILFHLSSIHRSSFIVNGVFENIINMDCLFPSEFEFIYRLDVNVLSKSETNYMNMITVRCLINNFCWLLVFPFDFTNFHLFLCISAGLWYLVNTASEFAMKNKNTIKFFQ